jgi:DNA-binding NarL/FixJ family response regulator
MFIGPAFDLDLVGEASADVGALPLIRAHGPDVVIVDVDGREGTALFGALKEASPGTRLLGLASAREAHRRQTLIDGGASDVLFKEASVHVVLKAIRRLRQCRAAEPAPAPSDESAGGAARAPVAPSFHQQRIAALTERERELVALIGQGLRNDQIAAHIGVAEKTVRNQLSAVFDKLGVNDRLGLVVYAFEHGLVRPTV